MRDELRFEVGVARDRVVALVTAQVALLVAFALAVARAEGRWTGPYPWVEAVVALVGILLAILAWPDISSRSRAIREWQEALAVTWHRTEPRPEAARSASAKVGRRPGARGLRWPRQMLARLVPPFFAVLWMVLAAIVILSPTTGR